MEQLGTDFNATGSVMTPAQRQEQRRKRGECVTCGQKCYQKKLFKMVAITIHGKVLNGRCLNCHPLDSADTSSGVAMPAVSRPATEEDLRRFRLKQEQLRPASARNLNNANGVGSTAASVSSAGSSTTSVSNGLRAVTRSGMPSRAASITMGAVPQSPSLSQHDFSQRSYDRGYSNRSLTAHRSGLSSSASVVSHQSSDSFSMDHYLGPERPPEDGDSSRVSYHHRTPSASRRRSTSMERGELDSQRIPSDQEVYSVEDVDDFRTAMERVLGYSVDEEEAYSLLSSGRDPVEILDDLRHQHRDPDQEGRLRDDVDEQEHGPRHGNLDRGGVVAFPRSGVVHRSGSERSGTFTHSNRSLSSHGNYHISASASVGSARDHSMRSVHSETVGRRERNQQLRRASSSSLQSGRHNQERADLYEHFSKHSAGRSSDAENSEHGDAYSRNSHLPGGMVRRRSENSLDRSIRDDTEGGLDRLNEAGPDYVTIVSIMRDYPGSAEVQLNCMEELSKFNFTDEDFDMLLDVGAMEVVVDAMQAFPQDVVVQMCGCKALCNTSGTVHTSIGYAEAGASDVVLDAMGLFLEDPRMQEQGLASLANLAAAQENISDLIDKGCVPQAVAAMNKYTGDMEVQVKGCQVVSNLTSHSLDVGGAIMEASGGGAVVLAMVMHSQEPEVQEKALQALLNLASNNDEVKSELGHMGGIDAVIQAMQVHRDDGVVQECGASVLSCLASIEENELMIGQCGGIDVTIRAMWVHSESGTVVEWCCKALFALSLHPENSEKILEVGGIAAIVNTMQAHTDSALVQEMCCATLCSIATHDEGAKEKIVAEEALDAIVLAMVLFGDHVGVQAQACMVLVQLANAANLKSMQASNVGELALTAASNFPDRCQEIVQRLTDKLEGLTVEYNRQGAAIAT